MTSSETEDMIEVTSDSFSYLDSVDNWLSSDPKVSNTVNTAADSDIFEWIKNAFSNEKSRGSHKNLVSRLDELNPSIDTRTFTRQKRNFQKRQSLFNGTNLSTLCSPVNEDDNSSPEANDRTFEVMAVSPRKSLNGTFNINVKAADSTFTFQNEELNNMNDVEKIAKRQEDSLRGETLSNGYSTPSQKLSSRNDTFSRINSNTLTKSRNPDRIAHLESQYNQYTNGDQEEDDYYDDQLLSPEETFHQNVSTKIHVASTPLVSKPYRITAQEVFREPVVPKIMPDVSNLKSHGRYAQSKIGRSEPNLTQRLQPLSRGMAFNSRGNHTMSNKTYGMVANSSLIHSKAPSDSRLLVRNGLRLPQNRQLGRETSPTPPQSQQQMLKKVAVEEGVNRLGTTTANATNLSRKSTFRVRDFAMNSEENLRENGNDQCLTNTSASRVGYQTNHSDNSVQRNVSKIPGPKTNRSGIPAPVSGQRTTAIQCPTNYRSANSTDNSWRNGCY